MQLLVLVISKEKVSIFCFYIIKIIYLLGATPGSGYNKYSAKLFHIIDLNCNGTEDNIFNCSYNNIQQHSCYYYEDAYVQCSGI